jgi:lipid-binding SYLF domain-containing protein
MNRTLRLIPVALIAALLSANQRLAAKPTDEVERIQDSLQVLRDLTATPDNSIARNLLDRAEAIVVIPNMIRGGFVVGAKHGKGIVSARERSTGRWSPPSFVEMTGGSVGWQIGAQSVDLVLLVMNRDGVKDLLDNEFKLGANASVAAGPVGRQGEASTDASLNAQILAYSRAKGLFAGLSLEGASLRIDRDANKDFYGASISTDEMVRGIARTTPAGTQWTSTLARLVPANSKP